MPQLTPRPQWRIRDPVQETALHCPAWPERTSCGRPAPLFLGIFDRECLGWRRIVDRVLRMLGSVTARLSFADRSAPAVPPRMSSRAFLLLPGFQWLPAGFKNSPGGPLWLGQKCVAKCDKVYLFSLSLFLIHSFAASCFPPSPVICCSEYSATEKTAWIGFRSLLLDEAHIVLAHHPVGDFYCAFQMVHLPSRRTQ